MVYGLQKDVKEEKGLYLSDVILHAVLIFLITLIFQLNFLTG